MKSFLLAAVCMAVLAASTTAWPYFWPPHHPFLPFPPHGGGGLPPLPSHGSFPSLPPADDMQKCMKSVHDSNAESCLPGNKYDAGKCCSHLTDLGKSCSYLPYYKTSVFQGVLQLVCHGGSKAKPSPSPPSKSKPSPSKPSPPPRNAFLSQSCNSSYMLILMPVVMVFSYMIRVFSVRFVKKETLHITVL